MRVDQPCKVLLSVIVLLTVWSFHPGWASQQVIPYNITSGELNPERPPSPCGSPGAALGLGGPTTYGDMLTPEELEQIEIMEMNSPPLPPPGIESTIVFYIPQSAVMLSEIPTSRWTYGCSATSAGMIFGYYDRTGFSDMYTGPTNGGVTPLTDLGQGIEATPIPGSCSIIATQNGFDGRTVRGHVDDYWIDYGEPGPDPWEGNWLEHTWEGCTADYMGTNQWKWDYGGGGIDYNIDGSTVLFSNNNSDPLYDYVPPSSCGLPQTALCHGLRLFAESRSYTVEENYTQRIDSLYPGGFSFADYMAEINAGHPVMIQVTGHSMVGVGYDEPTQTVYLHDTWDNGTHSMIWGGDYVGRDHQFVTVIHLVPPCTLDIDGNGQYDALTDGLLILRYLFGFTGATLIDGVVALDCTRCTAPEIEAYLADCVSCCLDIDGNGAADALTDGLLILRYLFGFTGATLIDGAVAPDCTRCTAPEIEAYIQGLMP